MMLWLLASFEQIMLLGSKMNRSFFITVVVISLLGCSEPPASSSLKPSAPAPTEDVVETKSPVVEEIVAAVAEEVSPASPVPVVATEISSKQVLQQVIKEREPVASKPVTTVAAVQVAMVGDVAVIEAVPEKVTVAEDVTTQRLLSEAEARDVAQLPETDRYVKVSQKGDLQLPEETRWSCILDQETGLLWETKSQGTLRHAEYEYVQSGAGGRCDGDDCTIEGFLNRVNQAALCGRSDWRLPKRRELVRLVDHAYLDSIPSIDVRYFSNTQKGRYWSADQFEYSEKYVWAVNFEDGFDRIQAVNKTAHLRLVSDQ
ncbi:hypothetical protein MNBD_GAMMA18-2467 [hydrothermal vent metagenome]|uniref:Lcl C-terminal domain-containing protein n=1 Tax=hydrothermal vent metagenome TaxID=652676 RepID=A0A3B0ZVU0_9ZZZZ